MAGDILKHAVPVVFTWSATVPTPTMPSWLDKTSGGDGSWWIHDDFIRDLEWLGKIVCHIFCKHPSTIFTGDFVDMNRFWKRSAQRGNGWSLENQRLHLLDAATLHRRANSARGAHVATTPLSVKAAVVPKPPTVEVYDPGRRIRKCCGDLENKWKNMEEPSQGPHGWKIRVWT